MADVGIRELLEAGVHFGHQTRRWNPKMRRFIHGERGGIYLIDLLKTSELLHNAQEFASALAHRGGTVLFVGHQEAGPRRRGQGGRRGAGMPYVNHRWLGGLLTNFQTISQRIKRLHDLERYETEGQLALLPTRERLSAQADLAKLRANLGGVKNMQRPPDAMFVIDLKTEAIAVREAQRLRIPIIGLVDTNCDPDGDRVRHPRQRRRDPLLRGHRAGDRRRRRARARRIFRAGGGARPPRGRGARPRRGRGARQSARPRSRPAREAEEAAAPGGARAVAQRRAATAGAPRRRPPRRSPRAAGRAADPVVPQSAEHRGRRRRSATTPRRRRRRRARAGRRAEPRRQPTPEPAPPSPRRPQRPPRPRESTP